LEWRSALPRTVDLTYPSNRAIALLSLIVAAGGTLLRVAVGDAAIASLSWGISAGFAVFLAWASCRELDPEYTLSAFVGAGLALIAVLVWDLPSFLPLGGLLVLLRSVNRTAGVPATILDSLLLLGLAGWLAWQGNWGYGLTTALAFLADGVLPAPNRRNLVFAGIACLITAVAFTLRSGTAGPVGLPWQWAVAVLVMVVAFVPLIFASRSVQAVDDRAGQPLIPQRVQAAQAIALLSCAQAAWWSGTEGVTALMPAWAAMLGASLYRLGRGSSE
jgi:hypothetical protein